MSKDRPWGKGTPTWTRDATANDSDKTFTVPAGKLRMLLSVHAELTATATVGNRALVVLITDGTDTVFASPKTASITATNTGVLNLYADSGLFTTTAGYVPKLNGDAPAVGTGAGVNALLLPAGYVIRIYDAAAVDAAADDLTVVLHYVEYDA